MPRIAFIANNTYAAWGGSEELWSLAALRLRAAGAEVLACVQNWQPLPARIRELSGAGVRIHIIRPKQFARVRERFRALSRAAARDLQDVTVDDVVAPFRPDLVVISQMQNYDGAFWARSCRARALPYALVAQAASEIAWPEDYIWEAARDAHANARRSYFVCRRNAELTEYQLGLTLRNRELVQNPFQVSFDQPRTWPADSHTLRLACVARLEPPAKGHDLLLGVLSLAHWRSRSLDISLYGDGRNASSLRGLTEHLKLSRVSFHGHTSDVGQIWQAHHGLILASRLEGTPLSLIEAMLCHRFAIVTDVGGNTELIQEGECGFVADAATIASLDAALERAWEKRATWRQLGIAAGDRVRAVVPRDPPTTFANRLVALAAESG